MCVHGNPALFPFFFPPKNCTYISTMVRGKKYKGVGRKHRKVWKKRPHMFPYFFIFITTQPISYFKMKKIYDNYSFVCNLRLPGAPSWQLASRGSIKETGWQRRLDKMDKTSWTYCFFNQEALQFGRPGCGAPVRTKSGRLRTTVTGYPEIRYWQQCYTSLFYWSCTCRDMYYVKREGVAKKVVKKKCRGKMKRMKRKKEENTL